MLAYDKIRFHIQGTEINSQINLSDNKWHTVIATWDGSNMKLYIDGNLSSEVGKSGEIIYDPNYTTTLLGKRYNDSEYYTIYTTY